MPGLLVGKRTDLLWIPNLMQLITVSVAGIILIPKYKLEGIIITLYLSHIVYIVVSYILSERFFPMPNRWSTVCILLVLMIAFITVMNSLTITNLMLSLSLKLIAITLYGVVGLTIIIGFNRTKDFVVNKISLQV